MSSNLVALCYGSALLLALALLWRFGARRWYWHAMSLVGAIALGVQPLPPSLSTPQGTLCVGWLFVFLTVWGVTAPAFAWMDHHQSDLRHRWGGL